MYFSSDNQHEIPTLVVVGEDRGPPSQRYPVEARFDHLYFGAAVHFGQFENYESGGLLLVIHSGNRHSRVPPPGERVRRLHAVHLQGKLDAFAGLVGGPHLQAGARCKRTGGFHLEPLREIFRPW